MQTRAMIALNRTNPQSTDIRDALDLLETLLEMAESHGWGKKVIEVLAPHALALVEWGDNPRAMAKSKRALHLGEPEGFIRTFVDDSPPMARLLYEALEQGINPDYVQRLSAAFPEAVPDQIEPSTATDLVEPLSDRELEVLQLIAKGLNNQEVGARLFSR